MLTKEQIQKLAEEKFPIYPIDNAELIGYTHAELLGDARIRFIEGYITCQNTEVAELKKELERVKGLLVRVYKAYIETKGLNEERIKGEWELYIKQHNL